jgi:DNA-nicking Smr family endonuclease
MARNKRRHPRSRQQPSQDEQSHKPFGELKALLRDVSRAPQPAPLPRTTPPAQPQLSAETQAQRERALFVAEMADVKRLSKDPRGYVEKRRQSSPKRRHSVLDELQAMADLEDLVNGRGQFFIQHTDEYMEGVAPGVDRRLAQRLHQGDFAVQGHLDLHGYTVEEAKALVTRFLTGAYTTGRRCIRLVHGRGHNSPDNRPVLKEQVQLWLSHGRLSRLVLAFATAPAADGGAGAVYVLLRRVPLPPHGKA